MKRILFVEDEPIISMYAASFRLACLKTFMGAVEVIECGTMHEAEELIEKLQFDAVILDLTLTDSPHSLTIERLKEFKTTWPPVLVMTGDEDIRTRHQCLKAGASDFTKKTDAIKASKTLMERLYNEAVKRYPHRYES